MLYLELLLVLLVPLLAGTIFLSLFSLEKELFPAEKLALSFLTGTVLIVLLMFFMSLLHLPLGRLSLLIALLILGAAAAAYLVRRRSFLFGAADLNWPRGFSLAELILLALLGLKIVYLFFVTLVKPVVDIDAISMYSAGAKGIFYARTFLTPFVLGTVHDKPLFPYLSQAGVAIGLGTFNDCLIKVLTPVMFLCLLVCFYSALRRLGSRAAALFFTFLLSTLPFLVFHAATAYSDFPQTVYYALGTVYLYLFLKEKRTAFLTVGGIMLGASIWIKRGSLALVVLDLAVLLAWLLAEKMFGEGKWKALLPAFWGFLVVALPAIVYSQAGFLLAGVAGLTQGAPAEAAGEGSRSAVIVATVLRKLFLYADWQLLWLLFVLVLVFCFRRAFAGALLYLLAMIWLGFAAILVQFAFGASFQYLLDGTLFDRLVMNLVPVVLFYCAAVLAPYWAAAARTAKD